jgi:large subunit ribosomal protein L35
MSRSVVGEFETLQWLGRGGSGAALFTRRLAPLNSTTQLPPCYNRLVFPAKIQGIIMPKLKTHKGASKRFKKTGTGLVVRNHAFGRHILTSKPHKRKKKLHQSVVADKADQPVLKRMIPY